MIQTTVTDYDQKQVRNTALQTFMAIGIISLMHVKFGYLRPLLLQSIMGLRTIYTSHLFKVYILGKPATGDLARPWKGVNSMG